MTSIATPSCCQRPQVPRKRDIGAVVSNRKWAAGRPRAGVEVRVVDENDCELPPGEMGELVVRTDCPWALSHGYAANPEATAKAWRNGWFHTGDGFKYDAEGNFYFCDRIKDAIRRRGENISSFEVESEVAEHPDVQEAAVVAVKSEVAEDEVLQHEVDEALEEATEEREYWMEREDDL